MRHHLVASSLHGFEGQELEDLMQVASSKITFDSQATKAAQNVLDVLASQRRVSAQKSLSSDSFASLNVASNSGKKKLNNDAFASLNSGRNCVRFFNGAFNSVPLRGLNSDTVASLDSGCDCVRVFSVALNSVPPLGLNSDGCRFIKLSV